MMTLDMLCITTHEGQWKRYEYNVIAPPSLQNTPQIESHVGTSLTRSIINDNK
jgi:hypothetical protein